MDTRFSYHCAFVALILSLLTVPPLVFAAPANPTQDPTYTADIHHKFPPSTTPPAQWIWSDRASGYSIVNVRGLVTLSGPIQSAEIYVAAGDSYTLYVDGTKVDSGNSWQTAHKSNVQSLLHDGSNVVAIQGIGSDKYSGIVAELVVNNVVVLRTSSSWKILLSSTPPDNWFSPAFDSFVWENAATLAPIGKGIWAAKVAGWSADAKSESYLSHIVIAPVTIDTLSGNVSGVNSIKPTGACVIDIGASETGDNSIRVDFGKELAGRIVVLGTPGLKVRITTGEAIPELTLTEPPLDNSGPYLETIDKDNDGTPITTPYSAFRYALLSFPSGESGKITSLYCDHKFYPVVYKGFFDCSDSLLTKIWYEGAYTSHLCMQEEIWDAPKRDRGLWCGDMHVSGEVINDVFGDTYLMERSIAKLRDIAQGGQPSSALPTAEINTLPGYTAAWYCELADFYRHSGDLAFVKSEHQNIITMLEYQKGDFDADHLFTNPRHLWNFVDWAPDFIQDSPQNHIATDLFDIQGVHEAVFLLNAVGDKANAEKYTEWANELTGAARSKLVDSGGRYSDRLQPNTMAVYSGVATSSQNDLIYEEFLKDGAPTWAPRAFGGIDSGVMSPYFGNYVLISLGILGKQQDAIDLIDRYWGNMVSRGQSTLWEKFDPSFPNDLGTVMNNMPYLSFCHGWSAGPTSFLSEYVLGIRPTSGGFATADIVPYLGHLAWAKGAVPTPHGLLRVEASKTENGEKVILTLPPAVAAHFGFVGNHIKVGGKYVPIGQTKAGVNYISLTHPGRYVLLIQ